jgi:hypothetical protein
MGCVKVEKGHIYGRVCSDDLARWKSSETEIAFEDRYLDLAFSSRQISICIKAAIIHNYHIPLIFIRKRSPEE